MFTEVFLGPCEYGGSFQGDWAFDRETVRKEDRTNLSAWTPPLRRDMSYLDMKRRL